MTFWSGEKLSQNGNLLVSNFDKTTVDCNSITLHVGSEWYRTAVPSSNKSEQSTVSHLAKDEWFVIPSGQFAFLITREEVHVPKNTMAFISMKSGTKFEGLVNISGFHVDPGYSGKLIFSVFNAGPNAIQLQEGMPLFLIWYADLDRETELAKTPEDGKKKIGKSLVKGMNSSVLSLYSLSTELDDIKSEMKIQKALFTWGVGVATAIFILILSMAVRVIFFPPSNKPVLANDHSILEQLPPDQDESDNGALTGKLEFETPPKDDVPQ